MQAVSAQIPGYAEVALEERRQAMNALDFRLAS
jgi:hypothetical protein